ncbi:MAG: hypothetical protein ACRDN0_16880 [Trebonia sp.]
MPGLAGWLVLAGAREAMAAIPLPPLPHALTQHPTATAAIKGASDQARRHGRPPAET